MAQLEHLCGVRRQLLLSPDSMSSIYTGNELAVAVTAAGGKERRRFYGREEAV